MCNTKSPDRGSDDAAVITSHSRTVNPARSITNLCAVFWHLRSFKTCESVPETRRPGLNLFVFVIPEVTMQPVV